MHAPHAGMKATALALMAAVSLPLQAVERRGSVAFHYGPALTAGQLAWFGRFDVLVTHDPLPPAQVAALHRAGTRLVIYEWSVAFYRTLVRRGSFEERMLVTPGALLNAQPLRGGSGAPDADAFYYDPATHEHAAGRPRAIAARLRAIGYDGVFLDTIAFEHVHPDALAEYKRRHPSLAYDAAFARFMRALRAELRGGVIITNQGYRSSRNYLPFVDYDVSESLITRPVAGGFALRPWNDPADPWNSIDVLMRKVIAPAARSHPRVRFVHLNYAPPALTTPIIAIARMFGYDAFVALPDVTASGNDTAYFRDLGAPAGPIQRRGDAAWRFFANGLVAVNMSGRPLVIPLRQTLTNVATGAPVSGHVAVPPGAIWMLAR